MRRLTNLDNNQNEVAKAITAFNICDKNSKRRSDFSIPEGQVNYDPENGFEITTYNYQEICSDSRCFIIMKILEHHVYNIWDNESWVEYEKIEIKIITSS